MKPNPTTDLLPLAIDCARTSGSLLRSRFGQTLEIRHKATPADVVTEVDLGSERLIVEAIARHYPAHNVVAEESGYQSRGSDWTWVIDPLDGTSNYAAALPWYGVMVAVLHRAEPVVGVMYLPQEETLYTAVAGQGAAKNDRPTAVTSVEALDQCLIAFATDAGATAVETEARGRLYGRLLGRARNLRATNCLQDFAGVIDGRLGGCVNLCTRIWDIAAIDLIVREAGGVFASLTGEPVTYELGSGVCEREYAVLAAGPALAGPLRDLVQGSGWPAS